MLFVLNRDFKVLTIASNEADDTLHYYDDKLHTELLSGVSTFAFRVSKAQEEAQHIKEGNFITTVNKNGKRFLFTIMEIEEDNEEKLVYCEDIGLDLLNETKPPIKASQALPIADYLSEVLADSGWEIGVNEIPHLSRTLEYTSYTNALERLLSICNAFDGAEVDFTVEFDGNTVTKQKVNIYKKRGKDTGIRLQAGVDLLEARRTVTLDDLATALYGVGAEIAQEDENAPKQYVSFAGIAYDDGRYFQSDGYLFDREANKQWSRYRQNGASRGYIVDYYSYDTESPEELLNRTLAQLKERSEPSVVYEVKVNQLDESLEIGDTITIVDSGFTPALYLSARVLGLDESETNPESNEIKLGNYQLLKPSTDAQLIALKQELQAIEKSWSAQNQPVLSVESTNGEAFLDNNVNTTLQAKIMRGGIVITPSYLDSDFNWTKKDRLGNTVAGWSRTGKSLVLSYADVVNKATFICTAGTLQAQVTIFNTLTTTESATEPADPQHGQQWIDTSVSPSIHKIYLSDQWQMVTPISGTEFEAVESAIDPNTITNTVMGTPTFTAKLAEYATTEELGGYATTGALEEVQGTAESAKKAIENLDLTPYIKATQIKQLEDSINNRISQSGGVNILYNSIGWNGTDFWTPTSGSYIVKTIQNPELESLGFGSGWYSPIGTYTHHSQAITLPALGTYTLSFYMKKSSYDAGLTPRHAGIDVIVDGVNLFVGLDGAGQANTLTNGFELFTQTFTAVTSKNITVRMSVSASPDVVLSGLMLNTGEQALKWSSHNTEVYNTNVRMDINGIQVLGNRDGSRTVITPDEFSGYENGERIFTLNGDTTEVKKLRAEERFDMAPISIVTIDNGTYSGWAFI